MASSGIAPNDGLHAKDPWRTQAQQVPAPAGSHPSWATTSFGTPQSAGSTSSLQARLQTIRMDPLQGN
eukprot:5289627-Pyramimonas_sp.AAC.1